MNKIERRAKPQRQAVIERQWSENLRSNVEAQPFIQMLTKIRFGRFFFLICYFQDFYIASIQHIIHFYWMFGSPMQIGSHGGFNACLRSFQMPLYGCLDDRHITPSSTVITDERVWNTATSKKAWKLYLAGSDENAISPYAAPVRAQDLADLPPAYICIGEVDLMRDENIEYAMRLMQAGVQTELHIYPGAFHGFDLLAPTAQVSQRAASEYVAALKRGLYR